MTLPKIFLADAVAPQKGQNMWQMIIILAIFLLFFYFMLWRPEQKRRKKMQDLRSSLKKGDKVVAMGIVGTIDKIKDKTTVLTMVDGSKIEILTSAISEIEPTETPSSQS